MRLMQLVSNIRIWILAFFLIAAFVAINPTFSTEGVAIRGVLQGSAAAQAGVPSPTANTVPRNFDIITAIDGVPIEGLASFFGATNQGDVITLTTDKDQYVLDATADFLNGSNTTLRGSASAPFGLAVSAVPDSNIRRGLDLQGGTRVLIAPEEELSEANFTFLRNNLEQRLNVFGLSDVRVTIVRDLPRSLGGQPQYILLEIAGANVEQVKELVQTQGEFIAQIANQTVFTGGNRDVLFVAHAPPQAGIGPGACQFDGAQYVCPYFFGITISTDAAQRFADATRGLGFDSAGGLSSPIEFYLDGTLTNSLSISPELRGRAETSIQITGSGAGATQADASQAALDDMKQLQTIIETGSLPVAIEIIKADNISPIVGDEFWRNAALTGLAALFAVMCMVLLRYRRVSVAIPMVITAMCEVFIVLGFAALIGWQLDLPAIAGLIIIIGTSVDHQIVIADEFLRDVARAKRGFRTAFFVIMASFATTIVAMLPLYFAGAGLLKNFALTTIIGLSVGVLITRPAFAQMLRIFYKK